jgi:glutamate racemase
MAIKPLDESTTSLEAITSRVDTPPRPTALIFDSGVGGLSVYRDIRHLLPDIHYVYAFDNAAFPYGEKSGEFIVERVLEIVTAVQQRHPLAIVVIACNTASTVSLPALRERFAFPIVGVVPAIKPAVRLTRNGVVGLLATRATVHASYTRDLIERFATDCKIELLGSSELVGLAETKLHGGVVPVEALKKILHSWLVMREPPDTIVLGCTHFPLLTEELAQVLPEGTRLVDSGAAIARRTAWLISSQKNVVSSQDENIAYCMALNADTEALLPVLRSYGFPTLQKLPILRRFD